MGCGDGFVDCVVFDDDGKEASTEVRPPAETYTKLVISRADAAVSECHGSNYINQSTSIGSSIIAGHLNV